MSKGSTTRKISDATAQSLLTFLARNEVAIVLLTGPAAGSEYSLQCDRILLGRGPDVHVVIDDEQVSRQHAVLELTREGFQLRDLGSTNGVTVKDEPVEVALLQHGDRFALGDVTFQYVVQERSDHAEFDVSDS